MVLRTLYSIRPDSYTMESRDSPVPGLERPGVDIRVWSWYGPLHEQLAYY